MIIRLFMIGRMFSITQLKVFSYLMAILHASLINEDTITKQKGSEIIRA